VEQTNLLKDVFSQVAQETRTPLALVSSWLRRAAAGADGDLAELLDKAQRQLRKMDVTLERVLRVASDISDGPARRTTIDLREFLDGVVDELPKADAMRIDRSFDPSLPPVVASAKDLQFCVHNLFGVLMRAGSQEDKLVVAARREAHSAVLEVHHVAHEGAREARERLDYGGPSESLRGEIASGIEVVKDTLQRMGAELSGPDTSHGGFAIYLPIAK
jgi:signal transduction histidine kinase